MCCGPGCRFARAAIGAGWEELALLDSGLGLLLDGLLQVLLLLVLLLLLLLSVRSIAGTRNPDAICPAVSATA